MKPSFLLLAGLLLATTAHAKGHVQVTTQAWIDKVGTTRSSHGLQIVKPFIKVRHSQLDGKVVEVGFRNQMRGTTVQGEFSYPWRNQPAQQKFGNDYFGFEIQVASTYHQATVTGPFYVKTDKGTYYWVKTAGGRDFVFDRNAFNNVLRNKPDPNTWDSDPGTAAPTQKPNGFGRYYNPNQLR